MRTTRSIDYGLMYSTLYLKHNRSVDFLANRSTDHVQYLKSRTLLGLFSSARLLASG